MSIFEEIKKRISVIEYAQLQGLPVEKEKDRTKSFIDPGDNKTCVVYYRDWWYDFKTRIGGDVIDLCTLLKHNGNISNAIRDLKNQLGIVDDFKINTNLFYGKDGGKGKVDYWYKLLLNDYPEYVEELHNRNISDKTIEELKIGYSKNLSRIMIPYYKHSKPVYYIGRTVKEVTEDNPKYLKPRNSDGYINVPWGLNTLDREKPLVITEGAFDALSFYQEGFKVLASMGGCFSNSQLKEVIQICRTFESVYLALDNDQTGIENTWKLAKKLIKYNIPFNVIDIPLSVISNPVKDVNDYYQITHELDSLINNYAIEDLRYIARHFKEDQEGFRKYCFKLARIKPVEDINYLLDIAKREEIFDSDWIKEFRKVVTKAPPQYLIANEILEKHELLFSEKFGYYEFNGSIWIPKTETHIKNYIKKHYGFFSRNTHLTAVNGLIKAETVTDIEFNKKNVITFKNSVLDLDSGKEKEFNKLDYSTIQLNYKYDPEAKCPQFEQFIDDITDSDSNKINLIQEVLGYCLYPENTLHKAFIFKGEGGNGKSVLLNTLKQLVGGKENISTVPIDKLDKEFQRIQLKDSMINIQYDYEVGSTFFLNGDSWFKAITGGDPINGCFKNKDFVTFVPRAKMIISCNGSFKTNDSSDGMKRRLIFIDFPIKFVDDPVKPNEKKKDIQLEKKLKKELPGIFNWIYEGYKRLKKNKKFTETEEQKILLEEFLSDVDPVIDFINSTDFSDKSKLKYCDAFSMYQGWKIENNIQDKLTQTQFSRKFGKEFAERYPNWEYGVKIDSNHKGVRLMV